jgi:hypothetical protein
MRRFSYIIGFQIRFQTGVKLRLEGAADSHPLSEHFFFPSYKQMAPSNIFSWSIVFTVYKNNLKTIEQDISFSYFIFWWNWDLNSGVHGCKAGGHKAGTLLLSHDQSILLWLFWKWGLINYLFGQALNHDSPHLSLPSN